MSDPGQMAAQQAAEADDLLRRPQLIGEALGGFARK